MADLLIARDEKLAVCESSAGGSISAALLAIPGASAFYLGGAVVYTAASRALIAGVIDTPAHLRGATEVFARYEAASIAGRLGATWGLGETGATGPAGNGYGDPAGHAWVAVVGPGEPQTCHVLTGSNDREANMVAFATAALTLLADTITATRP